MPIRKLICPLNQDRRPKGPITNTFYSQYKLTEEEIRLYEQLVHLPEPTTETSNSNKDPKIETDPEDYPDFHPIDCPCQFPSEPE